MVIVAHPDDPEFSAGGTVAKWALQGAQVVYVICTSGDKGTQDPNLTSEELGALRRKEQLAAAQHMGVSEVIFLPHGDGELEPNLALRRELVRYIRQFHPQTVITNDPTRYYYPSGHINHPDHRAVGEAALAAIFPAARDRLYFPEFLKEGLLPHKVKEVLLVGSPDPDYWVEIPEEAIAAKVAALQEHQSQVGRRSDLAERLKERAAQVGKEKGLPHAEAFKRLVLS